MLATYFYPEPARSSQYRHIPLPEENGDKRKHEMKS